MGQCSRRSCILAPAQTTAEPLERAWLGETPATLSCRGIYSIYKILDQIVGLTLTDRALDTSVTVLVEAEIGDELGQPTEGPRLALLPTPSVQPQFQEGTEMQH